MTIAGMNDFQEKCKQALIKWFEEYEGFAPAMDEIFIVWSCKTLQNYKCLVSTSLPIELYAEYTYNGDKEELYEDVYDKRSNRVIAGRDWVN